MVKSAAEWKRILEARLQEPGFRAAVIERLAEIDAAGYGNRPGPVARLGGFVRNCELAARLDMTTDILERLKLTPTQRTARFVMMETFGLATSNTVLDRHFASTGRTSADKFFGPAVRDAVVGQRALLERHRAVYQRFRTSLRLAINKLQAETRPKPARKRAAAAKNTQSASRRA